MNHIQGIDGTEETMYMLKKRRECDDVSFIYKRRDKGVFNEKKNEKTSKKIWRCTNLKDF